MTDRKQTSTPEETPPHRARAMKWLCIGLLVLFISAAAGLWGGLRYLEYYARTPLDRAATPVPLTIDRGTGLKSVAALLHENRLIQHPVLFELLVRLKRMETRLKAGEYLFSGAMSPETILDHLHRGQVRRYRVTLPEGITVIEIAERLEAAGLASREAVIALAGDPALCTKLGIPANHMEGYLFPDTYFFEKSVTPVAIVSAMVAQFHRVFVPDWHRVARENGFSLHEIVTLASIIEKETGAPAERPLISSVFHNRIRRGMRLQSDPTVIYGMDDFNGNITRRDLNTKTPYNTYQIMGLPPGPIASPGAQSLAAALYPADTNFLFFVSRRDGTHQFSRTLADHNRAVRTYQLGK